MNNSGPEMVTEKQIRPGFQVEPGEEVPEWILNEAYLVNEALDKGVVSREEADHGLVENNEILDMMRGLVRVTYFVEYPPENLQGKDRGRHLLELFSREIVDKGARRKILADYLAENGQAVSIAMTTLDESTAEAVRFLNQKGVPVIGWVVVDDLEGYWTNRTNLRETAAKTEAVKEWAKEEGLELIALGFDIEKPLDYLRALSRFNVRDIFREIRAYRARRKERAAEGDPEKQYRELIKSVKDEGYETEMYAMPKYMKNILGDMDVRTVDRYVEMVYTSDLPGILKNAGRGVKMLRSEGAIPALGIVSGKEGETPGRDMTGKLPKHQTPEELETNIRALLETELDFKGRVLKLRDIYLFALNGARVALMMDAALEDAFNAQLPAE